ncbi:hypothetical protein BLNAU_22928 [Blattamonas nauphoetae]|uniref:C3H1-type domain-containing protein n=1 Tax=Blattamonas nauphoetae TaxID=2049346 RepID=A0ABQ9WRP9_9EUKA|nr:hypothetical protein BLNAU_22928 [Blattamonas nauphoetae]
MSLQEPDGVRTLLYFMKREHQETGRILFSSLLLTNPLSQESFSVFEQSQGLSLASKWLKAAESNTLIITQLRVLFVLRPWLTDMQASSYVGLLKGYTSNQDSRIEKVAERLMYHFENKPIPASEPIVIIDEDPVEAVSPVDSFFFSLPYNLFTPQMPNQDKSLTNIIDLCTLKNTYGNIKHIQDDLNSRGIKSHTDISLTFTTPPEIEQAEPVPFKLPPVYPEIRNPGNPRCVLAPPNHPVTKKRYTIPESTKPTMVVYKPEADLEPNFLRSSRLITGDSDGLSTESIATATAPKIDPPIPYVLPPIVTTTKHPPHKTAQLESIPPFAAILKDYVGQVSSVWYVGLRKPPPSPEEIMPRSTNDTHFLSDDGFDLEKPKPALPTATKFDPSFIDVPHQTEADWPRIYLGSNPTPIHIYGNSLSQHRSPVSPFPPQASQHSQFQNPDQNRFGPPQPDYTSNQPYSAPTFTTPSFTSPSFTTPSFTSPMSDYRRQQPTPSNMGSQSSSPFYHNPQFTTTTPSYNPPPVNTFPNHQPYQAPFPHDLDIPSKTPYQLNPSYIPPSTNHVNHPNTSYNLHSHGNYDPLPSTSGWRDRPSDQYNPNVGGEQGWGYQNRERHRERENDRYPPITPQRRQESTPSHDRANSQTRQDEDRPTYRPYGGSSVPNKMRCKFHHTKHGCRKGNACQFLHD